jgi:branched-chain amino acid transport system substrate-binding protein
VGTSKKIKIGVIGPMKFGVGQQEWWGAKIAADEINEAGGVMVKGVRHEIELVKADSNETKSTTDAVNAMEKLATIDKVNFVTGGFLTEPVMAMQEVIADYRVIYIGGAGSPMLTERVAKNYDRYKYYFRNIHANETLFSSVIFSLLDMQVEKIRREVGISKPRIAFLLDKLKICEDMPEMGRTILPKMGAEIAGVWRVALFANDLTAELTAIKASGAHAIYHFLCGPSGIIFSRQWGELRIPTTTAGYNNELAWKRHWKDTNGMCEYATGYCNIGRVEITPKTIPFYDKFLRENGEYPSDHSSTYDNIYILKEAVERAGTLETEAVLAELEKTDSIGTRGRIAFYPRGHKWTHDKIFGGGYHTKVGIQWKNGEQMVVWPDGRHAVGALADKSMIGVKYKGTVDYKLPPWMVEYWKGKTSK